MTDQLTMPDWMAPDANWMTDRLGWSPRAAPVARLAEYVDRWVKRYTAELGIANPGPESQRRVWTCWAHHWRTAVERAERRAETWPDPCMVAERIEAGRGFTGNGNLGGNVIRDVVLVSGLLGKDTAAIVRFQDNYRDTITRQVQAARRPGPEDPDEWWNDLLGALIGLGCEPRLARFSGKSGLVPWTVTVAMRFLADRAGTRPAPVGLDPHTPDPATDCGTPRQVIATDCLNRLTDRIRAGLAALRPRERLALRLSVLDGLQGQEIARLFRIDPGNVSRLLKGARDAVWAHMSADPGGAEATRDCYAAVIEGGQEKNLADALRTALEVIRPEG